MHFSIPYVYNLLNNALFYTICIKSSKQCTLLYHMYTIFQTMHSSIPYVYNIFHLLYIVGRDSSVGLATLYGLYGPGIESRWGVRFSAPVQTGCETHTASYTTGAGSFPGVKWPGRGFDLPPTTSAEVKERVQPYLYSHSGHSWTVIG
jgi:hypothetical protein